ncbi:MAG: prepilin-type N-terminal cleavage/methylation domain-containing protein [Bacilli bacterium]|nr:prepilin-type N-terminal cleavage/methylation domain-containing protein [Bacilli bacterium]
MKRLNNKGVTLVELLVSFSIAAVIIISMFNVVLNYQKEANSAMVKNDVTTFKNTITKMLQNDLIKGRLRGVFLTTSNNGNTTTYTFTMNFYNSVNFSGHGNPLYFKNLKIVASNKSENYITYTDVNRNGGTQEVKYSLMDIGKNCRGGTNTASCSEENILKFISINSNINTATNPDADLSSHNNGVYQPDGSIKNNAKYFKLDIAISHPEFGGDYHINIVTPLNYPYCKVTD